jgi:hypothetical protein
MLADEEGPSHAQAGLIGIASIPVDRFYNCLSKAPGLVVPFCVTRAPCKGITILVRVPRSSHMHLPFIFVRRTVGLAHATHPTRSDDTLKLPILHHLAERIYE